MSDEKSQQPEPTTKEILASIRSIISDDKENSSKQKSGEDGVSASGGMGARQAHDTSVAPIDSEDDFADEILELTDKIDDNAAIADGTGEADAARGTAAPKPEAHENESGNREGVIEDAFAERTASDGRLAEAKLDGQPAKTLDEPEPARQVIDESLVSKVAAGAVTSAFAELARAIEGRTESVGSHPSEDKIDLDQLITELVRPMLKEWLDENLPALVEDLVRKEIQRMVGRAEGH